MDGGVDYERLTPYVLHDVDLPALGPAGGCSVDSHHPERGPHPLAGGQLHSGFDAAVFDRKLGQRFEARGSVLAGPGLARYDDQISGAIQIRVLVAAGIVLEFLIAPAAGAEVEDPLVRVRRSAGWPVKLVTPDQGPIGRRGHGLSNN